MTRFNQIERISLKNLAGAQQFTVEKYATKYLEVYRNVLSHDQNDL